MVDCLICKDKRSKLIFTKGNDKFFKCQTCKLVFIWPQPRFEKINQTYQEWGQAYYLDKHKIELDYNSSFQERINLLEPYRKNNRLLDVGCSIGAFLSAAREKKWDTHGVEISFPSVHYAKNIKRLNVFYGTLKEANYENEYFDVINIWAVLEHVCDPLDMLIESHRILRKGGVLSICVPNSNSLPIRLLGKKYRYIDRSHLFYFNRITILKMLKKSGFKIVNISTEYFSPLTFIEDLYGSVPDTIRTQKNERAILNTVEKKKRYFFIVRVFWRLFIFLIKKFNLGEEIRAMATK